MTAKYLVCPGYVTSRNDGETHYVGAGPLMKLYGVDPRECVIEDGRPGRQFEGLVRLIPRFDGNYKIPEAHDG